MKTRCRDLIEQGNALFSKRSGLMGLWQEIAENFYPERADFTVQRSVGTDFGAHLMTSYPVIARRELANSFSSMLRPTGRPWVRPKAQEDALNKKPENKAWLDRAGEIMRRAMYDRSAQFVRATKEGDNDFASFGQCVISVDFNRNMDGLLYRTWHLRDVVWQENAELKVDNVHRKWKMPARSMVRMFPKTVSQQVKDSLEKDPHREFECRHVIVPSDEYDLTLGNAPRKKQPYISLYIDCENETVLEEVPVPDISYVIPRWQTVSGSQYAHSPATVAALADARLIQSITMTLLEAGQKAVDPPMVAVQEAIVGGVNIYAGGVTYVDAEYDERLGEVLRPLSPDVSRGLSFGLDSVQDIREMIQQAFFLNKINLPEPGKDMTAFEVSKRMDEYVRGALPLFEPASDEYNGQLCEHTMRLLIRANAFGAPQDIPQDLAGADIDFAFESPLQSATERFKAQAFQEAAGLLKVAAEAEQMNDGTMDIGEALRDALDGIQAPASWIRPVEEVAQIRADREQKQAQAEQMQQAAGVVATAEQAGGAAQKFANAGVDVAGAMGIGG